jgi:uncharacterized protein
MTPIGGIQGLEGLVGDLLGSRDLRRLARIRHFGAFELKDWHSGENDFNGSPVTRLEHTLGVTQITAEIAFSMFPDERTATYNVIYALLHDIGHGPFSHSSEPVFRHFGINHHISFEERLFCLEASSIGTILKDHKIDVIDFHTFSVKKNPNNLFHYKINPDLIDGLSRSSQRLIGLDMTPQVDLASAFIYPESHRSYLDQIWMAKSLLYTRVMPSTKWKLYDLLFELSLYRLFDRLSRDDFYLDDQEFLDKYMTYFSRSLWGDGNSLSTSERTLLTGGLEKTRQRQVKVNYLIPLVDRASMNERYIDSAM